MDEKPSKLKIELIIDTTNKCRNDILDELKSWIGNYLSTHYDIDGWNIDSSYIE